MFCSLCGKTGRQCVANKLQRMRRGIKSQWKRLGAALGTSINVSLVAKLGKGF